MNGKRLNAFVTFLARNNSYLPGAILLAYGLLKQHTVADKICLVTSDVSKESIALLELVFDHVVEVEEIFIPIRDCQKRQYLQYQSQR